jgi:chromosome segregation ATPase
VIFADDRGKAMQNMEARLVEQERKLSGRDTLLRERESKVDVEQKLAVEAHRRADAKALDADTRIATLRQREETLEKAERDYKQQMEITKKLSEDKDMELIRRQHIIEDRETRAADRQTKIDIRDHELNTLDKEVSSRNRRCEDRERTLAGREAAVAAAEKTIEVPYFSHTILTYELIVDTVGYRRNRVVCVKISVK